MGNVFVKGYIQGLMLGGEHWGMVSLLVPWEVFFPNGREAQFFFHMEELP